MGNPLCEYVILEWGRLAMVLKPQRLKGRSQQRYQRPHPNHQYLQHLEHYRPLRCFAVVFSPSFSPLLESHPHLGSSMRNIYPFTHCCLSSFNHSCGFGHILGFQTSVVRSLYLPPTAATLASALPQEAEPTPEAPLSVKAIRTCPDESCASNYSNQLDPFFPSHMVNSPAAAKAIPTFSPPLPLNCRQNHPSDDPSCHSVWLNGKVHTSLRLRDQPSEPFQSHQDVLVHGIHHQYLYCFRKFICRFLLGCR